MFHHTFLGLLLFVLSVGKVLRRGTERNTIGSVKTVIRPIFRAGNPETGYFHPLNPSPKAPAVLRECELPASGYVHFFISETVPDGDWPTAPELAGSVAVFKNDGGYSYDEGGADGRTVSGEVPLTRALMTRQEDVNNIERIVAYLKTHLHWRCQLTNGSKVALEDVPSLEVRVCSAPVTVPDRLEVIDGQSLGPQRRDTKLGINSVYEY
ncbi:hypothetical protein A0H81_03327 [Grifola frondosa]|uniref:Tyrosinase C-terminal domain-containing protein n=1 Tax=Grifola frondosa TaxID=5627 RepID=A0A1C7MJY5_GRIFR|nr:hypothetical protein A0H81_03327 [Grifola frondosa]